MAKYMMIFHDSTTAMHGVAPAEIQKIVQRYKDWSGKIAQSGKLHGGHKLRDEGGKHLSKQNGKYSVRDGPYVEAKEIIGGYFVIEASDYREATTMCEDCPHLDLGGRIELREVELV